MVLIESYNFFEEICVYMITGVIKTHVFIETIKINLELTICGFNVHLSVECISV